MFVEPKIFSLGTGMEVPSKLRKIDGDAKRGCIQLAEVVSSGTGNARKPTEGSKCSATFGKREFTFSSKSTNLEHESYSPTFLSPMDNATGPEPYAFSITGDFPNQTVCVPDKIDATEFPSDFQCKDSDLQSTRLFEGNKDRKGKQVPATPHDGLCETNIISEVQNAGRDAKYSSSPSQKPVDTSTSGTYFPANTCSHNARLRENQHFRALPAVQEKNPLNGPALNIIWKGNFEIHDCPSNLGFCEGVLAHSSAKVSCRAYSFSKKISGNLHFVMYSQDQFSPDIFKMRCPDRDDIALYFYPGNYERSKHQYSYLLRFMEGKGLMLRSWMGSVELLVYPSSLLEVDSQKLGNCYFMWGVFHRIREDTTGSNARAQCTSPCDSN